MPAKRGPRSSARRANNGESRAREERRAPGAGRAGRATSKQTTPEKPVTGKAARTPAKRETSRPSAATRGDERRQFWLLKTEPTVFSYADLERTPGRSTGWDGVRNFLARNYMRDQMQRGDLIFIYHSGIEEPVIAGIAEVVREAYPDETAFDSAHAHYDPKSDRAAPTWMMVDVRAVTPLVRPLTLAELREVPGLESMVLLQRGSRLSVQPVSEAEWEIITRLGGAR